MATQTQHLYGIAGGRRRSPDAFWYPTEVSRLQQVASGIRPPAVTARSPLFRLLGQACVWLAPLLRWLVQPSEFVQLREADAVMRLLTPAIPERCRICLRPDWLVNRTPMCTTCYILYMTNRWGHGPS